MPARNWAVVHWKVAGTTFGIYRWRRRAGHGGVVLRFGPLGHVQFVRWAGRYVRGSVRAGRRKRYSVAMHVWGVRGRRRKRGIEIQVIN